MISLQLFCQKMAEIGGLIRLPELMILAIVTIIVTSVQILQVAPATLILLLIKIVRSIILVTPQLLADPSLFHLILQI